MNYLQSILCLDSAALFALEQQIEGPVKLPEPPVPSRLSAQVEAAATFAAVAASIANALLDPRAPRVPVAALKIYSPSYLVSLEDAEAQLAGTNGSATLASQLLEFRTRLELAGRMSEAFVEEIASGQAYPPVDLSVLADAWSKTCGSALRLVKCLELQDLPEKLSVGAESAGGGAFNAGSRLRLLCGLLEEAEAKRYPCVEADGCVVIPGWAERRREPRITFDAPATIYIGPVAYEIRISDASTGGLGISGSHTLLKGDMVQVRLPDARVLEATVRWVAGACAGLKLTDVLAPDDPFLRPA